jgi:hypothetical protein
LANYKKYQAFSKNFKKKNNLFLYVNTPALYHNLQHYLSEETWEDVKKNKEFIICFDKLGFQLAEEQGLFSTELHVQYSPIEEILDENKTAETTLLERLERLGKQRFLIDDSLVVGGDNAYAFMMQDGETEDLIEIGEITPDDLDADVYQEFYEGGALKFEVGLKDGVRNGNYREYYEDGTLKIKGRFKDDLQHGRWKIYNQKGKVIEKLKYEQGQKVE